MKKDLLIITALAAAVLVSCQREALNSSENKTPAVENNSVFPETIYASTAEDQDTRVGMDKVGTVYKHHWEDGDIIYVYKGTQRASYNCTNAASGVFELNTGATITIPGGYSFTKYCGVYCTVGDPVVSADETVSVSYTGGYTSTSGTNGYANYMVAVSNDGINYDKFTSLVGWVKLQLKGTKTVTSIRIAKYGTGEYYEGTLRYNFSSSSYSYVESQGESLDIVLNTPVTLNESTATDFYFALPAMSYDGMPFEIMCEEGGAANISTANTVLIERNKVTPMAVYTGAPITLGESEQANCYMVPSRSNYGLHHYRFPTKYVDGSSVSGVRSAKVVWETKNHRQEGVSPLLAEGSVVSDVYYSDGYIYFYRNGKGNALIAAYDGDNGTGNILWSWHIWIDTKNESAMTTPIVINGVKLMPVDLGMITGEDYGLSYQWGRKDPFYLSGTAVTSFQSTLDLGLLGTNSAASQAIVTKNPMRFYTGYGSNAYWDTDNDITRWAATKTNYDPCPPGWKVPEKDSFLSLIGYEAGGLSRYTIDLGFAQSLQSLTGGTGYSGCYLHTGAYYDSVSDSYKIETLNANGVYYTGRVAPLSAANAVRCQKIE